MTDTYSVDDLLAFLAHAGKTGLMPAATATALVVATRAVLGAIEGPERDDFGRLALDAAIARFADQRAGDFSPSSLKEYARRVHRTVDLFLGWRDDPATFTVKTRTTFAGRKKDRSGQPHTLVGMADQREPSIITARCGGNYESSFPIRSRTVVTVLNIPIDLTAAEAERLATFVKLLAVE